MNFDIRFRVFNDVGQGPAYNDRTDELTWSDITTHKFLPIIRRRRRPHTKEIASKCFGFEHNGFDPLLTGLGHN